MKRLGRKWPIAIAVVVFGLAYWFWNNYQSNHYLKISEWGITLPISSTIHGASYHLNADDSLAFLSTNQLDSSTACQDYYNKQQGASYYFPSFQYVARLAPNDQTIPTDGSAGISAKQAAQKYPDIYKSIGKYVYQYGKGRGVPCKDQTVAMTSAFYAAFKSIR